MEGNQSVTWQVLHLLSTSAFALIHSKIPCYPASYIFCTFRTCLFKEILQAYQDNIDLVTPRIQIAIQDLGTTLNDIKVYILDYKSKSLLKRIETVIYRNTRQAEIASMNQRLNECALAFGITQTIDREIRRANDVRFKAGEIKTFEARACTDISKVLTLQACCSSINNSVKTLQALKIDMKTTAHRSTFASPRDYSYTRSVCIFSHTLSLSLIPFLKKWWCIT